MNTSQLALDTLCKIVIDLQNRVSILEGENVETTNCLYEVENRLQSQIEAIINYERSKNFTEYELLGPK